MQNLAGKFGLGDRGEGLLLYLAPVPVDGSDGAIPPQIS